MAEQAAALERLDDRGRGVRVTFEKQSDRYEHTIFGVRDDQSTPMLKSLGYGAEKEFPINPVWKELHTQGRTLFLTGATIDAHWSMSVQSASTNEDNLSARLTYGYDGSKVKSKLVGECHYLFFDVACRLKEHRGRLGSLYQRCDDGVQMTSPIELRGVLSQKRPYSVILGSISLERSESCRVFSAFATPERDRFCVSPVGEYPGPYPATIQWQYGVCWGNQRHNAESFPDCYFHSR